MGIRKFEFVSKTQFLSLLFTLNFCWSKSPKKQGNIFLFANWIIQKTPQSIFGIIFYIFYIFPPTPPITPSPSFPPFQTTSMKCLSQKNHISIKLMGIRQFEFLSKIQFLFTVIYIRLFESKSPKK